MARLWILAFFIRSVLCAEGNNLRNHERANLAPGAGGYGSSNMEDNYDYILDDTPPRGNVFKHNLRGNVFYNLIKSSLINKSNHRLL